MEVPDCGILIDLSEPPEQNSLSNKHGINSSETELQVSCSPHKTERYNSEDNPLVDSIEIERSSERRGSYTVSSPVLIDGNCLNGSSKDITCITNDVQLIEDEEFDFDLPYSPGSRPAMSPKADLSDDEEVFIGPVGFTEKCVATVVSEIAPLEEPVKPLSPLKPSQIAEIFKEAQLVVYRLNKDDKTKETCDSDKKCLTKQTNQTPSKHKRKGTFTESPEALNRLPENVVQAMPVIDIEINDPFEKSSLVSEIKRKSVNSRLEPPKPSKLPASKLPKGNISKARSNECLNEGLSSDTDDTCSVTSDTSETFRLLLPRSGITKSKGSDQKGGLKRPSKLKPPGSANKTLSNENLANTSDIKKSGLVPPRKSLNAGNRKSLGLNTSRPTGDSAKEDKVLSRKENVQKCEIKKGPSTKLSLIKPGSLQKPVIKSQAAESKLKPGPLKAINNNVIDSATTGKPILSKKMVLDPEICTPVKPDKKVQPKLLSNNFNTPMRSSSVSSSTPSSCRRKSFLPTPQKTRCGSTSSIPQPSPLLASSSTSKKSRPSTGGSIGDSSSRCLIQKKLPHIKEVSKNHRHSLSSKDSPVKLSSSSSAARGIYQGRRSFAMYKTTHPK